MLRVGLTGGIGSGKSTVARIFRVLAIPVFEADAVGRSLLAEDPEVKKAVAARFLQAVDQKGQIDRSKLAEIVFNDPNALEHLNAIIHPAVRKAHEHWVAEQDAPYTIMEAAILVGSGGHKTFDKLVVVSAPEALRIQRVVQRDKVSVEQVEARMANQVSEEERLRAADHVIMNDDHQLVIPQVLAIHEQLTALAP